MSDFVLKNGMRLYYEEIGRGKPVVLLHGWTSDHCVFKEPAGMLRDKARFIMYDHRGHGRSKDANGEPVSIQTLADDLDELLDGLSLRDVTLVGWSMGATTALSYVKRHGCSKLRQLVLCDMTPKKVNDGSWDLGLYKGAYTAENGKEDRRKDFATLFFEYARHADPKLQRVPKPLLRAGIRKQMRQFDESVAMSLFNSMNDGDFRECLASIEVPLTYFYAVPGSLYPQSLWEWYRDHVHVPYQAVAFPDSTHRFVTEHPDRFAEELGRLL